MSAEAPGRTDSGAIAAHLGDPRFFTRAGPFALEALLACCGGTAIHPERLAGRSLTGVAPLQDATGDTVSVLHNAKYAPALEQTRAGMVIVGEAMASRVPEAAVALVAANPHEAWARISALFHPAPQTTPGVHHTACISPSALLDPTVEVGPYAVVGAGALIGPNCRIGPSAVIGDGVVMGAFCRIGALASLSHAILGDRVYIYPGARIGQEGFGFAITATGFLTVPQLGRVILQNDVEIGANSTVDRGASHDTVIGAGTRIDNLVQIGHNVQTGLSCLMAAQSGISGSTTLSDYVQIGAQGGLAGHLTIGTKARIGAQCGVMSDIPAGADVIGSPALPLREFFRNVAVLRRLARKGPAATKKIEEATG